MTCSVVEPEPFTEFEPKVALEPEGSPLTLKVTGPVNPDPAVIVAR